MRSPYKILLAFALLAPLGAKAQNAVTQVGTVLPRSPVMWAGDRQVRQGAGAAGDVDGRMITTGTGVIGGVCDFTAPLGASPIKMCLDAATGSIIYNGVSYPPSLTGMSGPNPSTINELASFNSTVGLALKQGAPAWLTDNKTTALTADGSSLLMRSQPSSDANAHYIWTCVIGTCWPVTVSPGNWDASRIVVDNPVGQTVDLVTGQGIYFINKTGRAGPPYPSFPVFVGQNIVGICDADGSGCWAGNAILSDSRGQGTPSVKALRYLVGWEADFTAVSTNTQVSGFMTGGDTTVQPAAANGYSVLWLDGADSQGTISKWSTGFITQHGSTVTALYVGTKEATGTNINSQDINMTYRDGAGVTQTISHAATPSGMLWATTGAAVSASHVIPPGAVFAAGDGGGLTVNGRTVAAASGTTVSFGSDVAFTGNVDVGNTAGTLRLFAGAGGVNIPTARNLNMSGGSINSTPAAAPGNPASGWYIYTDSGDGNKLKAKASTGTIIVLATP